MKKSQNKIKKEREKKELLRFNKSIVIGFLIAISIMVILVIIIAVKSQTNKAAYSQKAYSQLGYTSTVIPAKSGDILDTNMTPLAISVRKYVLILDPYVLYQSENGSFPGTFELTVQTASECFGIAAEKIEEAIKNNPDSRYLRMYDDSNELILITQEQKDAFEAIAEKVNGKDNKEKSSEESTETEESETQTQTQTQTQKETEEETKSKARIKGVWFETEYRRSYPYNELSSKVIGFATRDVSEGIWGLEKYYNEELRGENGRSFSYVNEYGNIEKNVIEPQDGYTIVSTIDINLTKLIRDACEEWFNEVDENGELIRKAKSYSVLAMDPDTAAVKAIVTDTDYNLNAPTDMSSIYSEDEISEFERNSQIYSEYTEYKEAKESSTEADNEDNDIISSVNPYAVFLKDGEWDHDAYPTKDDAYNYVWRNAVISDSFEPGSTGKIVTYAGVLEEGLATPETMFDDSNGFLQFGNTIIKCHNFSLGGCGVINAREAMAQSCNVCFMEMGEMLGSHLFCKYMQIHNFGQKTGIDLPGESSCEGLLYSEDTMNEVELATNSFGQCYNVTMLQMAAAYCADINGGIYYRPYTVKQILDGDGNIVKDISPVMVRRTVSSETSAQIRDALEYTVTNGTAYGVHIGDMEQGIEMKGYHFGAKTGTAQKLPRSENKYVISVVSAAPMSHPELLLYVVIDEYEGELQEDMSAPCQYLSGEIWYKIKDYIGLYSDQEVVEEEPQEHADDSMEPGNSIISAADGNDDDTPVPPQGVKEEQPVIENPDDYIDPDDSIVLPF